MDGFYYYHSDTCIIPTGHLPALFHILLTAQLLPCQYDAFFGLQKPFFAHSQFFYSLFINEDARIEKNRLSKLHYRFPSSTIYKFYWRSFAWISMPAKLRRPSWYFQAKFWRRLPCLCRHWDSSQNCHNETCISSKAIMQFTMTIFSDSVICIEKKRAENWLWAKSKFLLAKSFHSSYQCTRLLWRTVAYGGINKIDT